MRKNYLLVLILAFGLPSGSVIQDSSARSSGRISPGEILDKYLTATGGLDRRQSLHTLVATGDFGLTLVHPLGNFSFSYRAPSSDMFQLQLISHGQSWAGRRDERPIRRSSVDGADMINGIGVTSLERCWRSLLEWDFTTGYARIELVGRAIVNKKMAFAVRFTPAQGDPQVRYFDTETFLMVRLDQVQRFRFTKSQPEIAYRLESYYSDYRGVDGILLPRTIILNRPEQDLVFAVSSVKTGIDVDDAIFKEEKNRKE